MDWNGKYSYNFPTLVRFGAGVIQELGIYLKECGIKAPLIVTDPGLKELPPFESVQQVLKDANLSVSSFCDIHKNPVKSDVQKGVDYYRQSKCDAIIGLGGGASMDVARAIALWANHPDNDLFDFDDAKGGDRFVINEIPFFVTVPTTSGTGSEVGRSTVISDDETHAKKILFASSLMPRKVFADPELTYGLPPFVTAATGLDALTHNIEAFVSKGVSPMCDGIALEGIRLVFDSLTEATLNSDKVARAKMQMAALMGATAFQKGLGVVHSLAHPLSTVFDMHHGLANAIMLPHGIAYNSSTSESRYKRILKYAELPGDSSQDLVKIIRELNKKLGIPSSLSKLDLDWSEQNRERLASLALEDVCHQCNPKKVGLSDFKQLYTRAYES